MHTLFDVIDQGYFWMDTRSYLKKVFFPNLCVRPSFQLLDILEYACGLKLGPALTLSQNPIFEMASSVFVVKLPI
jgi:hypothetical protein